MPQPVEKTVKEGEVGRRDVLEEGGLAGMTLWNAQLVFGRFCEVGYLSVGSELAGEDGVVETLCEG